MSRNSGKARPTELRMKRMFFINANWDTVFSPEIQTSCWMPLEEVIIVEISRAWSFFLVTLIELLNSYKSCTQLTHFLVLILYEKFQMRGRKKMSFNLMSWFLATLKTNVMSLSYSNDIIAYVCFQAVVCWYHLKWIIWLYFRLKKAQVKNAI